MRSTRLSPILAFRERGVRQYDYVLIFPGENGYDELDQILRTRETLGSAYGESPSTHRSWPRRGRIVR